MAEALDLDEPDPEPQPDALTRALANHAAALVEHVDSVLILVTQQRDGGTLCEYARKGNLYSSIGAARRWLSHEDRGFRQADDQDD